MKKLLIILFILSGNVLVYGQYQSLFGSQTTEWIVMNNCSNLDEPYYPSFSLIVVDTVHESNEIIFQISGSYWCGFINVNEDYQIKEDTVLGKAWYRLNDSSPWSLFYDISLQVGDTIENDNSFICSQTSADSVYYDLFGRKHVRFQDSYSIHPKFEFIEGVGSTQGIPKTAYSNFNRFSLLCQFKDGVQTYSFENPLVVNCNYSLAVNENELKQFNLSPNPSNGHVALEIPENLKVLEINVLNMLGQVVFQRKGTANDLNLSFLEDGNYIVHIETSEGFAHSKMCIAR
jgi:hypothetical protein